MSETKKKREIAAHGRSLKVEGVGFVFRSPRMNLQIELYQSVSSSKRKVPIAERLQEQFAFFSCGNGMRQIRQHVICGTMTKIFYVRGKHMRNTFRFLKRFMIFASFFVNAFLVFWLYDLVGNNTLLRDTANGLKVTIVTLESKVKELTRDVTDLNREVTDKKENVATLETKLKSALCKVQLTEEEFASLKTGEDVGPALKKYMEDTQNAIITEVTAQEAIYSNKLDFTYNIMYSLPNDKDGYKRTFNVIYGATIGQKHDKDIHSILDIGSACFLHLSDYEIVVVND